MGMILVEWEDRKEKSEVRVEEASANVAMDERAWSLKGFSLWKKKSCF